MYDIKCDLHMKINSMDSRGIEAAMDECIQEAKNRNLELIAVVDSYSSIMMALDEELSDAFEEQFESSLQDEDNVVDVETGANNLNIREVDGVKVLRGGEVDIVSPEGYMVGVGLPISTEKYSHEQNAANKLAEESENEHEKLVDFIIPGVNRKWGLMGITKEQATCMYEKLLEDPRVLMLRRLFSCGIDFDVDRVLLKCKEMGKPVEIEEEIPAELLQRCAELSVMICAPSEMSTFLEEINFPQELIMNYNADSFLARYHSAGFEK